MVKDIKWQSLYQRLEDISDLNIELKELVLSALQLAQALESERTYTIPGNLPLLLEETSLTNRNEELD